jgi:hypothetical protein
VGIPGSRELLGNLKYAPIPNVNLPIGISRDERKGGDAYDKQKVSLSLIPGILAKENHHESLSYLYCSLWGNEKQEAKYNRKGR